MVSSTPSTNPLVDFWKSLESSSIEENCLTTSSHTLLSSVSVSSQRSAEAVNWMVENRGGIAKIVGLFVVPAQFLANNHTLSNKIINACLRAGLVKGHIEKINIHLGDSSIEGVICYPRNWKREDHNRCILYHNPNGVDISGFFENNRLAWTPGEIFEKRNCPIILYDYRGVGLNQDIMSPLTLRFRATYESIIADGQAALAYALSQFEEVEIMGSSLGGGVATKSLDRYLTENPLKQKNITQLINHDSFTNTGRVVLPNREWIADSLAYLSGGHLNAMASMQNLISKGLKVTIIYHTKDPVIPLGARMGDFALTLPQNEALKILAVPKRRHANLSIEMLNFL